MTLDANKRGTLIAFLLFFLMAAVLVVTCGEENVTVFVCDVVKHLITPLICLCFGIGVVCFVFSLLGVGYKSTKNLGDLKNNIERLEGKISKEQYAKHVCGECRKKVTELDPKKETNKGFELWGLNMTPNHLYYRLCAMGFNDDKTQNEISGIQDLHELTLQTELGRNCSSGMNTVISFLLILGILGTLTGVHGVIQSEVKDVQTLAPALVPSQMAVGFTVALIIMRGIYLCKVDRYIHSLDELTTGTLRPALSPAKSAAEEQRKSLDDITGTLNHINSQDIKFPEAKEHRTFTGIWQSAGNWVDAVGKDLNACKEALNTGENAGTAIRKPVLLTAAARRKQESAGTGEWNQPPADTETAERFKTAAAGAAAALEKLQGLTLPPAGEAQADFKFVRQTLAVLQGAEPEESRVRQALSKWGRRIHGHRDLDRVVELMRQPEKTQAAAPAAGALQKGEGIRR